MSRKSFSEYQSLTINKLCLRWEAIRRSPSYASDYKAYSLLGDKIRTKWVPESLDNLKQKYKNRNLLEEEISNYHAKWELDHLLNPNFSFSDKLNSTKSHTVKFKLVSKLKRLFRFKRAIDWPVQIFKIGIDDILDSSIDISDFEIDHKIIKKLQNISITIDPSAPIDQLVNEFQEIIKAIKDARVKSKIEIPPKNKKRSVVQLDDFRTYDLVKKKNKSQLTWSDWESISIQRYPERVGDTPNKIKLVQNEYKRAKSAIDNINPEE